MRATVPKSERQAMKVKPKKEAALEPFWRCWIVVRKARADRMVSDPDGQDCVFKHRKDAHKRAAAEGDAVVRQARLYDIEPKKRAKK